MRDRSWIPGAVLAVALRPGLWATAIVQLIRLAAPGWWRHRPFLPLPTPGYLHLRVVTMYGGDGNGPIASADVVTWLRWCRANNRR